MGPRGWFDTKASPVTLAMFRIAVFTTILIRVLYYNPLWFWDIPAELRSIPKGLGIAMPYVSITEPAVAVSYALLLFFCVTGLIGLFSRTSAALVALLSLYVMGVVQIYGKMTHCHHLVWFAAMLAVSRSGDMLAVDGVFKAFRRADAGVTEPPQASQVYGRPLVFIFLLFGVLYFFPGFWKVHSMGTEWFTSDNLKWHLHRKWGELMDWAPLFRIDRYPQIYKLIGFASVVFELSFIFLVLIRPLRPWLAFAGILFHQGTRTIMGISFWFLQTGYTAFVEWEGIFKALGRKMFRDEMVLLFDGQCGLCRRAAAALRVFDVLGRIRYVPLQSAQALTLPGVSLQPEALMKDMHAVWGKEVRRGYEAYQALSWRIPALWLAAPVLYFPPVAWAGRRIYRKVADSRTCSIVPAAKTRALEPEKEGAIEKWGVNALGSFLVCANAIFGAFMIHSWPFSVYPTFETVMPPETRILVTKAYDSEGRYVPFDRRLLYKRLDPSRWQRIQTKALEYQRDEHEKFEPYLRALWKLVCDKDPQARRATTVLFYEAYYTGDPDRKADNPIRPRLIYELHTAAEPAPSPES